ncbi:Antiholin-like protein LrgA [Marinobacterium lacunae]|uniref:Antiholin-like protein LrgA n=1 Tax=Marinobacterium lacunae TaxID=1232683 RepID=A0A081G3Q7_9GAMM|nr:CidA/LrgA family protein [Marinobacterium lacunae]KEA65412.1 Antiholin-like protein LrgA [Marinobacterium lacunae]MBR9885786.1 CidA/LrgA family protein [Oceanospirillales bacterium]
MLLGVVVLLGCQLLGELMVVALGLPVPGPVIGMLLLATVLLIIKRKVPDALRRVSENLLGHLALLFVPAGVGLMSHFHLLQREWLILLVTLVVSTAVTLAVTAWVLGWLMRNLGGGES